MKKRLLLAILMAIFLFPWKGMATLIDDLKIYPYGQSSDPNTVTGIFDRMDFHDNSRSIYDISDPTQITVYTTYEDIGHALVVNLLSGGYYVTDTEGLRDSINNPTGNWELTIEWDIEGYVSKIESDQIYGTYTGGTVSVWLDTSPDADFGPTPDAIDDTGFSSTKILEGTVVNGEGHLNTFTTTNNANRELNLTLLITYVNTNYIVSDTFDLNQLVNMQWLTSIATEGNNGLTTITIDNDPNSSSYGKVIAYGSGSGTVSFSAVPEPASILLLGGGLFVIGVVGRKKFSK